MIGWMNILSDFLVLVGRYEKDIIFFGAALWISLWVFEKVYNRRRV